MGADLVQINTDHPFGVQMILSSRWETWSCVIGACTSEIFGQIIPSWDSISPSRNRNIYSVLMSVANM